MEIENGTASFAGIPQHDRCCISAVLAGQRESGEERMEGEVMSVATRSPGGVLEEQGRWGLVSLDGALENLWGQKPPARGYGGGRGRNICVYI